MYKDVEKWALIHIENPLYYAGSFNPKDALYQKISKRNRFRENLSKLFEKAIEQGYKMDSFDIESSFKREMLMSIARAKKNLWVLYNLPKEITGQIDYIDYIITSKDISKEEFRKACISFPYNI